MISDVRRVVLGGLIAWTILFGHGILIGQNAHAIETKECKGFQCRLTPIVVNEISWLFRAVLPNGKSLLSELTGNDLNSFPLDPAKAKVWWSDSLLNPELRDFMLTIAETTTNLKEQIPLLPIQTIRKLAAISISDRANLTQSTPSNAEQYLQSLVALKGTLKANLELPLLKSFNNGVELYGNKSQGKIVNTNEGQGQGTFNLIPPAGDFSETPLTNDLGIILLSYQAPKVIYNESGYSVELSDWTTVWTRDGLFKFFPASLPQLLETQKLYNLVDGTLVVILDNSVHLLQADGKYKRIPTGLSKVLSPARIPAIVIAEENRLSVYHANGALLLNHIVDVNLDQNPIINQDNDLIFNLTYFIFPDNETSTIPMSQMININVSSPEIDEVEARIE